VLLGNLAERHSLAPASAGVQDVDLSLFPLDRIEQAGEIVEIGRIAAHAGHVPANLLYGLIELPCETRYGFVWVVQRPGAPIDVAAWIGPEMDAILTGYRMDAFEVIRMSSFEEPMNWKVLEDAFIDGYHLKFVHPNSAGPYFYTNIQAVEDFGRHVRTITPRKVIDQIRATPDEPIDAYVTVGNFLMPNTTILRHSDHYETLTFVPHATDPNRCRLDVRVDRCAHDAARGILTTDHQAKEVTIRGSNFTLGGMHMTQFLDIQNVYMNESAVSYIYGFDYTQRAAFHQLPILPTVGLRGEF